MRVTWQNPNWRNEWSFPKEVPDGMKHLFKVAEHIRKNYPQIWKLGGNTQGNDSYRTLAKIVNRGYFITSDKEFIKVWQAWMARHFNHVRPAGLVASLKWLHVPEAYTVSSLVEAIENLKPKNKTR